ncbi:NAD(P)-dependent oxidoreductase [Caldovatus aquaticus]|uniref:NAD(P)-dependent oxidoreductase n=1 Tax=Caldovatus aquaticus TaxID=2865671 RepID=A0ABS7EZI1_9PROT|nr:NAD(P)-dependent oxidoreductase [Caldovatus aquaticus]MBW8267981.1 NAD(P)-dependent oxidoreductase [Caldovatus aquaticus]
MARIGIAGLGRMGSAIGARLLELGHELTVWNRTPEKARPLAEAGAAVAPTPAALAGRAEAIITILTDAAAIESVYGGAEGLLAADLSGRLVIEMSTVRPETEVALAGRVRARGGAFVECPVGGTTGPARQGKLLGLAGGEAADVARARPLLEQMCRRVEHVGPVGAGASMKLAINLPLLVFYQALGEALTLCRHLGHDPAWLMELFADTSGGPNVLKVRGPAIARALSGEDPQPPSFDIDSIRKDLRTMLAEAEARGADLPLVRRTLAIYDEAAAAGWGRRDGAALPSWWPGRTAR